MGPVNEPVWCGNLLQQKQIPTALSGAVPACATASGEFAEFAHSHCMVAIGDVRSLASKRFEESVDVEQHCL